MRVGNYELNIEQEGYPVLHNWKDFVDENTVVVIDNDQLCFVLSSAMERTSIKATNINDSSVQFICKNKTEFWGGKKKVIEGILGELNSSLPEEEQYQREDFTIEEIQEPEPKENLFHTLKLKLLAEVAHLGLKKYQCFLGGKTNFRLDLKMPMPYKFKRKGTRRPVLLNDARDYILKHHNGVLIEGMESDDALCILGYQGYLDFLKTGKFSYIIAAQDKDSYGTPMLLFNNHLEDKRYKHPVPHFINSGVGKLFKIEKEKSGKTSIDYKGYGFKWLCWQMLMGDYQTDGYGPYQHFPNLKGSFGEATCYELLKDLTTEKECLEALVDQYKKWFPEEFEFEQKDLDENLIGIVKSDWLQWAETIFSCAYMKRKQNDTTTLEKLLKHFKVEY